MQIYQQYKTHHLQDVFKYVANGLTTFYSNVYLGVVMFHVCHQIMSSTCFKTNDPMVRNVKNLSYTTFFKLVEYTDCNSWTHKKQAWWPFVGTQYLIHTLTIQIWTSNTFFGAQWKYFFIKFGYMIKYQCKLFSFHVWNTMFIDNKQLNPIPSVCARSK